MSRCCFASNSGAILVVVEAHLCWARPMSQLGQTRRSAVVIATSALPPTADIGRQSGHVRKGRVEDGRGSLGHSATLRFPSPLIEPDVPISPIPLSDSLHPHPYRTQPHPPP